VKYEPSDSECEHEPFSYRILNRNMLNCSELPAWDVVAHISVRLDVQSGYRNI